MFCRKCGQEIREGAKFCTTCGTPVQQPQAQEKQLQAQASPSQQAAQPQMQANPSQQAAQLQMRANPSQQAAQSSKASAGKGKSIIIALICVIVLILAAIAGLCAVYMITKDNDSRIEERRDNDRPLNDETEEVFLEKETETGTEVTIEEKETQVPETKAAAAEVLEPETEVAEEKPHEYRIVVKDVKWTEAYQEAKLIPNGYLVNIDSEEEWNLILEQIKKEQREDCIFWIGAIRRGESDEYFWVDANGASVGEALNTSTHWLTGEPTFYDAENDMEERYVDMFFAKGENRWVWNDTPDDLISLLSYYSGKVAYIVEIENE